MLAVTMPTLRKTLLDDISESTAIKIVEFAEAKCNLDTKRGTRYLVKRIEDALDYCCDHPAAMHKYKTITEARKGEGKA